MYKIILVSFLFLAACAQLMQGAEQPVVQLKDNKTFKTTCSGMAEDWGSCHRKAKRICTNGYEVTDRYQDTRGIVREMVFTCK